MKTGNKYRDDLAKRTQQNLVEMGCIPPPDAVTRPLNAEKPAPIDQMEVPEITVPEELVLKYGRRMAMLIWSDQEKGAKSALSK